jgi:hypothetical protein
MTLTTTQLSVVARLKASSTPLHRWPSGHWTTEQIPADLRAGHTPPRWSVGTRTVTALITAGVIRPVVPREKLHRQQFELTPDYR